MSRDALASGFCSSSIETNSLADASGYEERNYGRGLMKAKTLAAADDCQWQTERYLFPARGGSIAAATQGLIGIDDRR